MPNKTPRKIVFYVYDSPQFSADLWRRFRDSVSAQEGHVQWVDELRGLIERYLSEHPPTTAPKA